MSTSALDTDRAAFLQLERLVTGGSLHLEIDRGKLTHMDFPLASEADGNLIMIPSLAACFAVFWEFGTLAGLASLAVSFALYQTLGKRFIARRIRARVLDRGLTELDVWQKLWRFGGVILATPDGSIRCQGPEQSWTQFLREFDDQAARGLRVDSHLSHS